MKRCSKCGEEKPLEEFSPSEHGKYGVTKVCKSCKRIYDMKWRNSRREKERARGRKYRTEHKEEVNAKARRWREKNPERRKAIYKKSHEKHREQRRLYYLRRNYGLAAGAYAEMVNAQGGVCAICGKSQKGKHLAVDHDHETGFVRGLLCEHCNHLLGYMRDDPEVIQEAADYLARFAFPRKAGEAR